MINNYHEDIINIATRIRTNKKTLKRFRANPTAVFKEFGINLENVEVELVTAEDNVFYFVMPSSPNNLLTSDESMGIVAAGSNTISTAGTSSTAGTMSTYSTVGESFTGTFMCIACFSTISTSGTVKH